MQNESERKENNLNDILDEKYFSRDGQQTLKLFAKLTKNEIRVFVAIRICAKGGRFCEPEQKELSEMTGLSQPKVSVAVTGLKKKGVIKVKNTWAGNKYEICEYPTCSFLNIPKTGIYRKQEYTENKNIPEKGIINISETGISEYTQNRNIDHLKSKEKKTHTLAGYPNSKPIDKFFRVCISLLSEKPYAYPQDEAESEAKSLFKSLKPENWQELAKAIDRVRHLSCQLDESLHPKNPIGLLRAKGIQSGKCAIRVNEKYRESWLPREVKRPNPVPQPQPEPKEADFDWSPYTKESSDVIRAVIGFDDFLQVQFNKHGLDSLAVRAGIREVWEIEAKES